MFARFLVGRRTRPSSASHPRRLAFESLDSRCFLSATPLEAEPAPLVEVTATCQPEVAPVDDTAIAAATDELLTTLGPEYPALAETEVTYLSEPVVQPPLTQTLDGPEGEAPAPLGSTSTITALEITEFKWEQTIFGKTFSGHVEITGTYHSNLKVYFDGLLQGQSTFVASDGSFVFQWAAPPGVRGDVSAQAIDGTVESNIEWVHLV